MLAIVTLHVLGVGGVLKNVDKMSCNGVLTWAWEFAALAGVNCFAMATGYLYVERKRVKYASLLSIILRVFFYSVSITAILGFQKNYELSTLINGAATLVFTKNYWYVSCYILLFVTIPYINRLLEQLDRVAYRKLLATLFLFAVVLPSLVGIDFYGLKNGYSSIWLIVCYLFGGYFKKYGVPKSNSAILLALVFVMNVGLYMIYDFGLHTVGNFIGCYCALGDYSSPFILINAVILTTLFLKIPNVVFGERLSKNISLWSAATLGIYLTHNRPILQSYFYAGVFNDKTNWPTLKLLACVIGVIALVFVLCGLIEIVRMKLFSALKINERIVGRLGSFLDSALQ